VKGGAYVPMPRVGAQFAKKDLIIVLTPPLLVDSRSPYENGTAVTGAVRA
jgi:hypothetical protein